MEHSPPAHAGCARDHSRDLRLRTLGTRERGRICFRAGAGDGTGAVSLYAISDSGCGGGPLADANFLVLSDFAGTREARALDVLGLGRRMRPECADQGIDRFGLSRRSDWTLPVADRKPTAPAETAPGFECARIPGHRCALAHSGGVAQSGAGKCARIFVVLLC